MLAFVTTSPLLAGLQGAFVDPSQWETLDTCPICRRSECLRDVGVVEGGTIASVCLDCEYGFLRRRPVNEWYDRFYSKEWDQSGRSSVENSRNRGTKPNARPLKFCAGHLPRNAHVLDVGAGFGSILLAFRGQGYNVYGIERSEHRAKYVQDVLGIPCSRSPIQSFRSSSEVGLVCMNHVLEHVSDPAEMISVIAAMLPEGGMIYIAVPDFWRGEFSPQTFHFVPHLSSFTVKSLRRLLARHGLHLVKAKEDKEIQVLAVKGRHPEGDIGDTSDPASRSDFWDKTSTSVLQAFGARAGHHTIVWFEDKSQNVWFYQRHVFSGPRLISALLKLAIVSATSIERALPEVVRRRVHRALPGFLTSGRTRMLTVGLEGDMTLPVHIKHPRRQAPVWIK